MFKRPRLLQQTVNWLKHLPVAVLAVGFYRYPARKLIVVGVTGTDGKTTTAFLIDKILETAGRPALLVSTVATKLGKQSLPTGLHITSPSRWKLQRLLRQAVDQGIKYAVIEATSHGLDQYRLLGSNFHIGVITNVAEDHLDYHRTLDQYLKAKAKLFSKTKVSILNKDDSSYSFLKKAAGGRIISYGMKQAAVTPQNWPFKSSLIGRYNQYNCLAAIAVAQALGIDQQSINRALADFKGVKGRMEPVDLGQEFKVFIDFAHTPNALKNALAALRLKKPRQLIAVFGCAGRRDKSKRPKMGRLACRLADQVVLTAEDPRTEQVETIIDQIAAGCQQKSKLHCQPDRERAIQLAIVELAQPGDIVAVFGKGHERSMAYGQEERPWSEYQAVKKALRIRLEK